MPDTSETPAPFAADPSAHPWRRYVALGDSFTEGVGDPEPSLPNVCADGPIASPKCSARRWTTSPTPTSRCEDG